jgi:deoxyribodipyrimidine photo-lyase
MQNFPILVWFRNDLRAQDHAPLYWASQSGAPIIVLYCIDPQEFEPSQWGNYPRTGGYRAQFLLESLCDLQNQFVQWGGNLNVVIGKAEDVIPLWVEKYNIKELYYYKAVAGYEKQTEARLLRRLEPYRVKVQNFWGHSLYSPEDLPFLLENTPERFTDFRQTVEPVTIIRPPLESPKVINFYPLENEAQSDPNYSVFLKSKTKAVPISSPHFRFKGGEKAGMARIENYFWQTENLKNYKLTRNGLLGDDYSSQISPYLALGNLSARWVFAQIENFEKKVIKNESTYWLFFELLWRDFFYFIYAKHGNRFFLPGGVKNMLIESVPNQAYFQAWITGKTGYPLVDAAMRELAATGYMSNRARQNVASFFIKNLGLPWLWGASWFESLLVDYDVSSNYGNWSYIAGVGNDPRGFRYFNVTRQAEQYDPEARYIKHWLPELKDIPAHKVFAPYKLTTAEQKKYNIEIPQSYPAPIVDFEATTKQAELNYKKALLNSNVKTRNSRIRKFVK